MALMALETRRDHELFDESAGYESDTGIRVAPGLTEEELRQARTLYRLFNELWGVIAVFGDPGTGKDTFGNYLQYTIKRYFPDKRIFRDERPRKLFGMYDGLFNDTVIREELAKMRSVAKGARRESGGEKFDGTYMEALEKAADTWVSEKGAVMLQNAIVYLTEFWRYCYNREPHSPMNKTMGGIFKQKRHINSLFIGTGQLVSELDKKTCLPWIDWRVTCTRSRTDTTRYTYIIEKVKYDRRLDLLIPVGRPFAIPVDAGKPRSFIGDGKIVVKRPNYAPETQEERIVLECLKAGVDRYEDLVTLLETEGDMSEWETLNTLKHLCLKLPGERLKGVISYPCYYFIFNSRSAPNMTTKLRVEE